MKIYKVYYTDYYEVKRISYFKDLETLYTNFCVCFGALENSLGITKKELLKNIVELVNNNISDKITIEEMEI